MKVSQVMSHAPVTVHSDEPVRSAVRRLAEHQITMMPVVDGRGRIRGVVAEGDLLGTADARTVEQVMTATTVLVHPGTDLRDAWRVLCERGLKSLPVVDAADQVVGVLSRSDVVRLLAREDGLLQEEIVDAFCRAGLGGWRVEVHNGVADLFAPVGGPVDSAAAVADAVLGVRSVHVH